MEAAKKMELGVGYTLTFTREFEAPRELVFRAWTDPIHLAKWWGPEGFTNPVCEFEARPGGRINIDMTAPDSTVYPMSGEVLEIEPPARLVFTSTAFQGADGPPGLKAVNTVTFVEAGDRTTVSLQARVVRAVPEVMDALAGMEAGWTQSLERLAETVDAIYSE
ncbi:SRPBCC family protein [Pelagibius marinus]|uniref:SRPBCC family protein n=1 Tax=Pelagibius marinus TaxID=2762760 RepID=UPI001D043B96|nr:SRPBCC domain-containing protein [Pelagibius marinus]